MIIYVYHLGFLGLSENMLKIHCCYNQGTVTSKFVSSTAPAALERFIANPLEIHMIHGD